ncbi:MAG: exo-alpha-sialidase [Candidatus Latescibacteria bacterium]|nr:exo-alpha-sialidase [Candidatus Latescibacterota bacterium]
MLKIDITEPITLARHEGMLTKAESTHHYCTVGRASDGTILAFYSMHPDIARPPNAWVPVRLPGSHHPIYKFRPRQTHPDYRWPHGGAYCRSEDGGRTWSAPEMTDGWGGSSVPAGDQTLSPYGYLYLVEPGLAVGAFRESGDGGRTWKDRPDVFFRFPPDLNLYVTEDRIADARVLMNFESRGTLKALSDGAIVTTATAQMLLGDRKWWLPVLFRSTDKGQSFEFVGLPTGTTPPPNHRGFTEPALTELSNGDLLAAFRVEYHQPDRVMMQCRSSDGGATWTGPVICPGVPRHYPVRRLQPIVNQGKTHLNAANVSPYLTTLSNGVVAMVYGRPGVYITFSEEGTGEAWRDRLPVVTEESLFGINCDSSHMAGVIDADENELVMLYDVYNYRPPDGGPTGNTVFALRMRVEKA